MREILFRGKNEDGKWLEGDLFQTKKRCYIRYPENETYYAHDRVVQETVGQYTGLTDKNGKKIFEGDIVKDLYLREIGLVSFCQGTFDSGIYKYNGWVLKRIDGRVDHCELAIYSDPDFEIVGNIHDNPELWEEGEQK